MIKILKTKPITLDGEDCLEVFIEDTHFVGWDNCAACLYHDIGLDEDNAESCLEVYGCTMDESTRFIRLPLVPNVPNLNLQ